MKTPTELTELFRAQGLKVTPQRQCIFRILHDADVHPTAEAVYAQAAAKMPTMSLRTVYQTLNDLAAMGELTTVHAGPGPARFDPNLSPHHHLVCSGCGAVRDLALEVPEIDVPDAVWAGFEVEGREILIRGRCAECRAAHAAGGPAPRSQPTTTNTTNTKKEARKRYGSASR